MNNISVEIKEKIEVTPRGYLIKSFIQLAKLRVTAFVALSASFGYILYKGLDWDFYLPTLAVFFTAIASSALNQLQERKFDKQMPRTMHRPLPSKKITKEEAIIFIVLTTLLGLFLISLTFNWLAIGLILFSMVWYNLIYTPLKRKSALAVLPGALLGATPPIIGWVVAGGSIFDTKILFIATFLFLWQIPHFWFLFLIYNDEYKNAGYPTLKDIFNIKQIGRISFIWILSLAMIAAAYPFYFVSQNVYLFSGIYFLSTLLIWQNKFLLNLHLNDEINSYRTAFRRINLYVLLIITFITIDKIISNK